MGDYSEFTECCSSPSPTGFGCHGHRAVAPVWDELLGDYLFVYYNCPLQWVPKNVDNFVYLLNYHKEWNVPMPQLDQLPARTREAMRYLSISKSQAAKRMRRIEEMKHKGF